MAAATMLIMMAREESSKQQQTNNYPPLTPPISDCSSSDGRCSPDNGNIRNNSRSSSRNNTRNNSRFRCSDCGRDYATSSNLSRHRQTHRAVESGGSKSCPTCGNCSFFLFVCFFELVLTIELIVQVSVFKNQLESLELMTFFSMHSYFLPYILLDS